MKKLLAILFLAVNCQAASSTTIMGLIKPDDGDTGWGTSMRTNFDILDSSVAVLNATQTFTGGVTITSGTATRLISDKIWISTPTYTNSTDKLVVKGISRLAGTLYLCDSNFQNCPSLSQSGGSLTSINSCNNTTGSCLYFLDSVTDDGTTAGPAHIKDLSTFVMDDFGSGDAWGSLISPTYYNNATGVVYHTMSINHISSGTTGGTYRSVDILPRDNTSNTNTHVGIKVDMGAVNGLVTNANATKVTGRFLGGTFIVEGSTKSTYSLIVSTENITSYSDAIPSGPYALSVSTIGVNAPFGLKLPSKTLAQLQAMTPTDTGLTYYCSNCVNMPVCYSTGTATAFAFASSSMTRCQ